MRKFWGIGLLSGLLITFGACDLLLEEEENAYVEVQLDTDYVSQSINGDDFRLYTFVSESAGSYSINITNLFSDVDWYLFENEVDINNINFLDAHTQGPGFNSTVDEIGTADLTSSTRYWLIVEEFDGINSSFDLRIDTPSSSGDVQSPQGLDTMEFIYYGESLGGAFNTDVDVYSSSTGDSIYFWINDGSTSFDIDEGVYTLNVFSQAENTLTNVGVVADVDYSMPPTAGYAATTLTEDDFLGDTVFATIDTYDQIISGTVTVSVSGPNYTFEWNFTSLDGDTIAGSYTGPVDEYIDESGAL